MLKRAIRMLRDRWDIARDPVSFARRIGVRVGNDCMLNGVSRKTFGSEPYLISLGNHVGVGADVLFITHDGGTWMLRHKYPHIDRVGRIVVHDNVVLGVRAIVMPDVEIGPNAVVAAGAVVTRSVLPNTVVGGVPARVLMTLEEYEARALERAVHVAHLPIDEKRQVFIETTSATRRRDAGSRGGDRPDESGR